MREIFCCGTGQRTAYCATCGRRLQAYPLSDLLNHCREQAHNAVAKLRQVLATHTTALLYKHRDDLDYRPLFQALDLAPSSVPRPVRVPTSIQEKDIDKRIATARQWTSWAAALERIMKHAATLPSEPDAPTTANPEPGDTRNLEV